jgi:hypothetical protein
MATAALRILRRSNLEGSTKQFGWLQAPATRKSFLSAPSANPATIQIDNSLIAIPLEIQLNLSIHGQMSGRDYQVSSRSAVIQSGGSTQKVGRTRTLISMLLSGECSLILM